MTTPVDGCGDNYGLKAFCQNNLCSDCPKDDAQVLRDLYTQDGTGG